MTSALDELIAKLGESVLEMGHSADGTPFVRVTPEAAPRAGRLLRDQLGYARFVDLTAIDDPERPDRFDLVYLVASLEPPSWLRLKTRTAHRALSLVDIYPAANWYEREVFDMFGVSFDGHPDLRRILMPDDWSGHPLRRDEPLGGEPVQFTAIRGTYGS